MTWHEDSSDEEDDEMLEQMYADSAEMRDELRKEEDEPLPGWVPEGAQAWNTSSRLERPEGPKMMGRKISEVRDPVLTTSLFVLTVLQYIEKQKKFSETVTVDNDKPFVLKPVSTSPSTGRYSEIADCSSGRPDRRSSQRLRDPTESTNTKGRLLQSSAPGSQHHLRPARDGRGAYSYHELR